MKLHSILARKDKYQFPEIIKCYDLKKMLVLDHKCFFLALLLKIQNLLFFNLTENNSSDSKVGSKDNI